MIRQFVCLLLIPTLLVKSTTIGCPHVHTSMDGQAGLVHIHLGMHGHDHQPGLDGHHHRSHHHGHHHHGDQGTHDQHQIDHLGTQDHETIYHNGCLHGVHQHDCGSLELGQHRGIGRLTSHCDHDCDAIYLGCHVDFHNSPSSFSLHDLITLKLHSHEWPSLPRSIELQKAWIRPPIPPDVYVSGPSSGPLYLQILRLLI